MDRLYCNLNEILADLKTPAGFKDEEGMLRHVRAASEWIDRNIGAFYPVTEARTFRGDGTDTLHFWSPLLSVTSITDDGVALALTDYNLTPENKLWRDGPYVGLKLDDEGDYTELEDENPIVITGAWGLYNVTRDTGTDLSAAILAADTSLSVYNGARISPGSMLVLESEQVLVEASGAFSDSTATITADPLLEDTLTLSDSSKVKVGEILKIEFEQMKVLDIITGSAYVARGWNNTNRVAHAIGTHVYALRTFTVKRACDGTTAAGHAKDVSVLEQRPPEDINLLCRQIAALIYYKAATNFSGRQGDPDTGETFYLSEFPKTTIDRIRRSYEIIKPP